jgi:endonuclease/exonuclease/phosphatase family metal-dependent hydrolase
MGRRPRARLATLAAAAIALGSLLAPFAASSAAAKPDDAGGPGKPITVMTRNLYLGADIQRPIDAAQDKTGLDALVALANSTYDVRQTVSHTDFNVRGRLLAREIAQQKPDLVGLQEVALWRSGPLELPSLVGPPYGSPDFGQPNATTVDYDFLAILLSDLRQDGARYEAVSVQQESDVEAPSFQGNPFSPTFAGGEDVRLTMRDVIIKRVDNGVKVVDGGSGQYTPRLEVPVAGQTFAFIRGYNWVDVRSGSGELRFVNTHLEAFSSGLALAQADELLTKVADDPNRTTVIVCDCNSDPLNHTTKPPDPTPHSAPYDFITDSGFTDAWLKWAPAEQGFTSGLSETVDDPTAKGFDHRIDMVFVRDAGGAPLSVDQGTVTGTRVSDRDPATGLWPSDHGGVVLRLRGLLS